MFKAIKDNKIIAVNDSGVFPCLIYDEAVEDTEHNVTDFTMVDSEFVLDSDEKAVELHKQERIAELKQMLADADYWGQKYIDGEYTEEEWAEKVTQRKAWRVEIRELEGEI